MLLPKSHQLGPRLRARPDRALPPVMQAVICNLALCLSALGSAVVSAQTAPSTDNARAALTVSVVQPQQKAMAVRLHASGNIAAWQEAIISADVDGLRLVEVTAEIGERVQAGQVLARYANDSLSVELKQAQASVIEAQANLANVRANASRTEELLRQGFLSAQSAERQSTSEQLAQAQVARAEAAVALVHLRLQQTEVRAPDHGVLSSRSATIGAVHGRGVELFRLIRLGRLEWRAEVTAAELMRLRPGQMARITLADGTLVQGVVRALGPTIDLKQRTGLVYVDLPPMGQSPARAGSFVQGELILSQSQALTLPLTAVVRRDGFAYVYLIDADNRVRRSKVQTGRIDSEHIEISSGVSAQARIVASGAAFLNDGDLVQLVPTALGGKP